MDDTATTPAPLIDELNSEDEDKIGVESNVTEDGGIKKKILVRGLGWQNPEQGDEVEVHYVGTLEDGTPFDSSRERGEPFSFKLGVGQVIKGWDQGVETMKKGEKAVLICRGDYAYGAQGSPPKIPANATLHFEVELLSWKNSKDISEAGDGGIIKSSSTEGEGWANPGDRDEVLVHYTATVAGAEEPFAKSPEGGQEFSVSAGHLVPALAVAIKTMKKGEKAELIVQPAYGLGAAGQPPAVGADAVLNISVELVSWKKVEDVTKDGLVVKKTVEEGRDSWKKPNDGATVTVRYTARLADGTVVDEQTGLTFVLEDGEVPVGLELAVAKMHLGEKATLTVGPTYAYGEADHKAPLAAVPANSTLTYDVELVSMENLKELWEVKEESEKLATAVAAKEKGNVAFKAGKNAAAIKQYNRAVKFLEPEKTKPVADDLKAAFKDARKSSLLNLAAAQLKLSEFKDAISSCNKVLELDSSNIKALYRLAQAHLSNGDYVEAEISIKRGLQVEERNADLLALQKKLKLQARAHNQKQSQMYSKMFAPRAATAAEIAEDAEAAKAKAQAAADALLEEAGGPAEGDEEVPLGADGQPQVSLEEIMEPGSDDVPPLVA